MKNTEESIMYRVVVSDHFDAAHHLPGVDVCCRPHGHTFRVEACVCTSVLNPQGMVVDFRAIKQAWNKYDHDDLNDFFDMPTAENLCKMIFDDITRIVELTGRLIWVEWVKIWESPDAYCEFRGE